MYRAYQLDSKVSNLIERRNSIYDFLDSEFIESLHNLKDYKTILISESYKLDLLAYENYSDYNKWWIIAIYNNIVDPFEKINGQKTIKIPNIMELDKLISNVISNRELK